ncbi:Seven TM Receptor [Caenorhabditis elegans]|uniref:Seven TM Receptor n=1 Tax=Caenorhabditis elegans TaxID=6239 RepID=O18069_CAEEL|nr:Seven TM Receptor [Caenorhabditis elegans]CAB05792.2 Seven TM Receptor [Caenorhabditis elegans]|eukprot:NP_507162.2 Seven TM Receptor [Caenorhabditis elegans]
MMDWSEINKSVSQFGFFVTTSSQLTVIFLTVFCVRRDLGAYKHLVVLFSTVGVLFALLEFLLYPASGLHSHSAAYIVYINNRPFDASKEFLTVLLAVYCSLYCAAISLLAVQFIYRYIAVFCPIHLKYFNKCYLLIWIFYAVLIGVEWGIGIYKFDEVDEYSEEYMRETMMDYYQLDVTKIPCLVTVIYQTIPNSTETFIRWKNAFATINMTIFATLQYSIMIYCSYKLYNDMEEKLSLLSEDARKLHRQIFKTLLLQLITPTIAMYTPVFTVIYLPFLNLEYTLPTGIFMGIFALYPALDAVILMYVITDYRRALIDVLKFFNLFKKAIVVPQQPTNTL